MFIGLEGVFLVSGWPFGVLAQDFEEGTTAANDGDESVLERSYSLDRYASLWEKSLFFSVTSVVVADAAFAKDYSLAGVFEMNGATTAALVSKRDQSVVNVSDSADAESGSGMRLVAVESAGDPGRARVQVEKAGQRAWVDVAPSSSGAGNMAPTRSMPLNQNAAPAAPIASGRPVVMENFPKPMAPEIAPKPATAPLSLKPPVVTPTAPPMPPSPLDAAMSTEDEIVVPIPDGK